MQGFYKMALYSLDIKVIFTHPHHPQSNGIYPQSNEHTNVPVIQNIRILSKQLETVERPSLTLLATLIHYS